MTFNFYFVNDHFQTNSELKTYYNFRSFGPRLRYPEFAFSQGILYAYGNKNLFYNPFISCVSNQTYYEHSVAYSYNVYLNSKKTSQLTGIVALEFGPARLITENDLLARPMHDRFRTAAMLLQYQYLDQFQAGINCTLWTGKMGFKTESADAHFPNKCYVDTTGGIYPNVSHGLLSFQFNYHPGYGQNLQANAGIDAEQVRNALQNKFIHDMPFVPRKLRKARNCHIPMIDSSGRQYLFEDQQKIRKAKTYLNMFANTNLFY
ncbi:MAG: hypothetical protein JNL60_07715 [Bacteroidia bacterium]|nr:hypothetical protein [Bacteroidia bacterium]